MVRRKTNDEFKEEFYDLVGDEYTLLTEYQGRHGKITVKHNECGTEYKTAAGDFLKGRRCKKCYFMSQFKTNEKWLAQVKELTGNDFMFLETYKGDDVRIRYRHICGDTHSVTPNNFINGTRCPKCKESTGESNVRRFLTENNLSFESQKSFDSLRYEHRLLYDFYIEELGILIEFQGIQHYEPVTFFGGNKSFEKQKEKDALKRKFAESEGLKLIEIKYDNDSYEKVKELLNNTMFSSASAT